MGQLVGARVRLSGALSTVAAASLTRPRRASRRFTRRCLSLLVPDPIAMLMMIPRALSLALVLIIRQKSSKDPTPATSTTTPETENGDGSLPGSDKGSGISVTGMDPGSDPRSASESTPDDGSWLAGLAMGVSSGFRSPSTLHSGAIFIFFSLVSFFCL